MRQHRDSVLALGTLVVLAAIGAATYRDYGASWDEPEYYEYASSIRSAYALEAHLEQEFRIEDAYGSTSYFHKFYGPAYLLLAGGLVERLKGTIPGADFDVWHLVNFLTFLAGVGTCIVFGICKTVKHDTALNSPRILV